ncbi:MAG TPA: globin domain-containing protein [Streptosporangiaceae bacterium]|nr:globin domain-containing protein [Streptosporangiaceae bacterium]
MAIALDSGYPDDDPSGSFAGQRHLPSFERRLDSRVDQLTSLTDPYLHGPEKTTPEVAAGPSGKPEARSFSRPCRAHAADVKDFDARLVKESFAHVAANAEAAMEHFYARLFVRYPEIRSMFPHAMRDHMQSVFAALARIVWSIDSPDSLTPYLSHLGRCHRKFGVKDRHFEPLLSVLIETIRHFSGYYWTAETQAAWEAALGHAASVMQASATRDAAEQPPWWIGEVVQHDQRSQDLAVLTIKPDQSLRYEPGQYLAVQVPRWPRVWRNFSIANAPRPNGLLDLHVRAVPGGMVSGSLVHNTRLGDTVLLGPACGEMTLAADQGRDLLCVAGGTGLAPLKAIIEDVINASKHGGRRRTITLFFGAQDEEDLYDLPDLRVLEWIYPALTVVPVVSGQPDFDGITGMVPDAVAQYASCENAEIFVCGPDGMVRRTIELLADRVPPGQIRHDPPSADR